MDFHNQNGEDYYDHMIKRGPNYLKKIKDARSKLLKHNDTPVSGEMPDDNTSDDV